MRWPFGTFDHKQFVQRELNRRGQFFDLLSQVSFRQRSVLVKQWGNEFRINDHHKQHEYENEGPQVENEILTSPVDDFDDGRHQRQHDGLTDNEFLDLIFDVKSGRLLVESVFLFQDEGVVDGKRESHDGVEDVENAHEEKRTDDFAIWGQTTFHHQVTWNIGI